MKRKLSDKFIALANAGELPALLKKRNTLSLKTPTLGGKVFWRTIEANGWKLQGNYIFGNWRILDKDNVQQAWGFFTQQLEDLLYDRPTSQVANYIDHGFSFAFYPAEKPTGKTIFLIHGWICRGSCLADMARAMNTKGYDVYVYDYETSKYPIEMHAVIFLAELRKIFSRLPQTEEISVVTHSMGGIVIRAALNRMAPEEARRINNVVQMGPPNRGSLWAILGRPSFVRRFNASLGDMQKDADSYVNRLPAPQVIPHWGVIAANYDDKVQFADTTPPAGIDFQRTIVNCHHMGLCNPNNTLAPVLAFLETGSF